MRDHTHIEAALGRARQRHLKARVDALIAADQLPVEAEAISNACRALVALTRRTDDVAALQVLFIEAAAEASRGAAAAKKQAWRRGLAVGGGAVLLVWGFVALAHLLTGSPS
jgi:hypothetical protein